VNATGGVGVVVVSFNTRALLRDCLASVLPQEPAEVVVVDNGSRDGSAEEVRTGFPGVRLISCPENPGFGAAANRGVASCESPFVLLLNADTRLEPGALPALVRALESHPRAGVVGPRLLETDGRPQSSWFPAPTPFNLLALNTWLNRVVRVTPVLRHRFQPVWARHLAAGPVPWIKGAALGLRRAAFEQVGGFEGSFFLYAEDVDLCFRLRQAGWEVRCAPEARIVHVEGASTRQARAESVALFFDSLGRFYQRHYPPSWGPRLRRVARAILFERLVRDTLKLAVLRDPGRRRELAADRRLWRQLLAGRLSLGGADPD
jgi:N-acetylglucosaminyl-diphospho-decaprenol L-rhamnosyltransferase